MKTNLSKQFKTDAVMENEGIEFEINGVVFRLRRNDMNVPKVREAMATVLKPYSKQIQNNVLPPAKGKELEILYFVKGVMIGWSGLKDAETGEAIEFSEQAAVSLLTELPDLHRMLAEQSADINNYKVDMGN